MSERTQMLIPMLVYLALMTGVALWANRSVSEKQGGALGFMEEYFLGSRSMGGIVLAMTIVATYTSASSFIGGPGVAYNVGLGWILLSMIQVPTAFLTLGVLGKRFAIISRRARTVTFTDFLRARYNSDLVVIFSSLAIVVFFMASMVAQFIGGARLFEAITGYSYQTGLIIFGITVIVYTSVGGFRAVVLTDVIQGIVMLIASTAILAAVISAGGGIYNIMAELTAIDPELLSPYGPANAVPKPMIMSFWVLVGFAILGLPQTTQKALGFKDTKSLHNAMIVGTFVVGFTMLTMHLVGVLGRAVLPGIEVGDLVVPKLTIKLMSPFWAGVFIAGPMAAIMSTVDSMLIMVSAAIIKDLYFHYVANNRAEILRPRKIRAMSTAATAITGVLVFLAALRPPSLLVWINLFAFGGLEAVFFCPTVFGLYWRRANSTGALCSMTAGCAAFFWFTITKTSIAGTTAIVPSLAIAAAAFVGGSLIGKKEPEEQLKMFDM